MRIFKATFSCLLATALIEADGASGAPTSGGKAWNYKGNGADWPSTFTSCGPQAYKQQSPVDLKRSAARVAAEKDKYQKHYQNVRNAGVKVDATKGLAYVDLQKGGIKYPHQYFKSAIPKGDGLKSDDFFVTTTMQMHAESQHTIDGKRFDLELTISHVPKTAQADVKAGALSILFDTTDFDENVDEATVAMIDSFFDSFNLVNQTSQPFPQSDEVLFGELLAVVDTDNRWVYYGSKTTPPCTTGYYWNVLSTVYPLNKTHLAEIKTVLGTDATLKGGNYRQTSTIDVSNTKLVYMDKPPRGNPTVVNDFQQVLYDLFVAIIICWVVLLVGGAFYWIYKIIKSARDKEAQEAMQKGQKLGDMKAQVHEEQPQVYEQQNYQQEYQQQEEVQYEQEQQQEQQYEYENQGEYQEGDQDRIQNSNNIE